MTPEASDTVEVTIEVTQEMIDTSVPTCPSNCVLAQALQVFWPKARVGMFNVYPAGDAVHGVVSMSDEMVKYRTDFDNFVTVSPRSFTFRVPKHLAPPQSPAPQVKADEAMLRGQALALGAVHDTLLRPGVVKSARARLNDLERRIGETRVVNGVLDAIQSDENIHPAFRRALER